MTTLGPNQTRWIEALRSNQYQQGREYLHNQDSFCCLGVACAIFPDQAGQALPDPDDPLIYEYNGNASTAPLGIVDHLGLFGYCGESRDCKQNEKLTALNDKGHTFLEIADLLTAHPEAYFSEPL